MEPNQKIDVHNREQSYKSACDNLEKDSEIIPRNKELIINFLRDCRLGKTLKKRQKKVIGIARCLKYLQILKKVSDRLDKPFDEVTQQNMESFIEKLENDHFRYTFKSKNGTVNSVRKYAHSTKLDYKKSIKKFYKWLWGNNEHYPELVEWIETFEIPPEIPALNREEIEKMVASVNIKDKALIMTLFDSGARAEEFLNIRLSDLTWKDNVYRVRIQHSKTKPRTIHLPIASPYLRTHLDHDPNADANAVLFPLAYDSLRQKLYRIGKQILKKRVTPHVLRHSSATYYSNHLSHFQLCYRYGWAMASKMPNRYLDREGILDGDTTEKIHKIDTQSLEKQNKTLREEIALLKQTNHEIGTNLEQIQKQLKQLTMGKNFLTILGQQTPL